ncbi:MAG TPA: hypothetical protein VK576_06190 [Thermoleophilia bacterium]|nr:hypothetical protein [Thermoleophilia bacterium]
MSADVPAGFADREWTEFVRRSLFDSAAIDSSEVASVTRLIDASSGTVRFESEPDRHVKVSVDLEYTPVSPRDEPVPDAQARLERDLERFRAFVTRRCDETHCRG